MLSSERNFQVDNKVLGGDPIRYTVKELQIIYKTLNETKNVVVREGEQISLDGNTLLISRTKSSIEKQTFNDNIKKLAAIFDGEWEQRAAELIVANKELTFQNQENEKRAAELLVANVELAF